MENNSLEAVKRLLSEGRITQDAAEEIFPELKESEDERIRKEIITFLDYYHTGNGGHIDFNSAWIAWLKKQGSPKMSAEALREGIAYYGITQYQIDNWLKKYVEIETTVCPKYEIGDVIRLKNSNHEFIISRITDGCYHSKGAFIEISIADDVNGDWEYVRHIQPEPKFNVGDTIIAKPETCMEHIPFHITSIEGGFYWDGDDSILIDNQDDFVLVGETVKEPAHKFKVDDWIIRDSDGFTISIRSVKDGIYYFHEGGNLFVKDVDECFHLWTIQDAKDGDVLAEHETIVLFKEIDDINIRCYCTYHYLGYNPALRVDTLQNKRPYRPATKEQRDKLEKAITEADYKWDAEKKELKKIEQNPAWSEEDEKRYTQICVFLQNTNLKGVDEVKASLFAWLKDLKKRYAWKPSDEQLEALEHSLGDYNITVFEDRHEILTSLYQDIKKLKGK